MPDTVLCIFMSTQLIPQTHERSTINVSVTVLLKYNSYTIQFAHLKCMIQWFLVYSELCDHQHKFRRFSSPQKETLYPLAVICHYLSPLETTNLLFVSMNLLILTFHVNEVIQWSFVTGFWLA